MRGKGNLSLLLPIKKEGIAHDAFLILCGNALLDDHIAIYQIGALQSAFNGNGALHQVGENNAAVLAVDLHHIAQDHILLCAGVFIDS